MRVTSAWPATGNAALARTDDRAEVAAFDDLERARVAAQELAAVVPHPCRRAGDDLHPSWLGDQLDVRVDVAPGAASGCSNRQAERRQRGGTG